MWNTPTVDPKRHAVYFGTGDATTAPSPPTTDAVMAAGGTPAPEPAAQGGGFPVGAAVAAGSVLLAVTLGLRIARPGSKDQSGRTRGTGRIARPGTRPATAQ